MKLNFVILFAKNYIYNCKKTRNAIWILQFSCKTNTSPGNWRIQTNDVQYKFGEKCIALIYSLVDLA